MKTITQTSSSAKRSQPSVAEAEKRLRQAESDMKKGIASGNVTATTIRRVSDAYATYVEVRTQSQG